MNTNKSVFRKEDRFTVYTKKSVKHPNPRPVRAKWLFDRNGQPVINPRTGKPYIAPADYSLEKAIRFGHQININDVGRIENFRELFDNFNTNRAHDLQRSYNGLKPGGRASFVEEFRDIASFHIGLVAAAAGISQTETILGGGVVNLKNRSAGNSCLAPFICTTNFGFLY